MNTANAQQTVTTISNAILWVVSVLVSLLAAGIMLTAFASFAGFRVPYFKTLGTTELAYAMGAWWLYKKA